MATINQDGVTRLMNAINNANATFANSMKNGTTNFANATAAIWESNNAVKFASNLKTDLDNIADSYKKSVQGIYDVLTTNVSNHNKRNDGSVSVSSLDYSAPDTSALSSKIKNKFGDGSEGVKEGSDISSVQADYTKAMETIKESLDDAVNATAKSEAFGTDEINTFKTAYQKIKTSFEKIEQEEANSLRTFLEKEKEADTKLASTNKSNLGQ